MDVRLFVTCTRILCKRVSTSVQLRRGCDLYTARRYLLCNLVGPCCGPLVDCGLFGGYHSDDGGEHDIDLLEGPMSGRSNGRTTPFSKAGVPNAPPDKFVVVHAVILSLHVSLRAPSVRPFPLHGHRQTQSQCPSWHCGLIKLMTHLYMDSSTVWRT